MKHNMTFLKRCLALVLALVMVASSSNLGFALKAFAVDESENKVTVGELMVNTYDQLTAAEQALLKSGLLADDYDITYTVPSDEDGLVTINAEEKTVTVASFGNWTPVQLRIIANNDVVETIVEFDANGVAAYTYAGDAFTAEVDLELTETVAAGEQENMLNAAANLKAGLKNLAVIKGTEAALETVEAAIPAMGTVVDTAKTYHVDVSEKFVTAVETLEAQVNDYGMLLLRVMNGGYEAKVQYMMENGADTEEALRETYNALDAIRNDDLYNNSIISNALKAQDSASYTQWVAFQGVLADLMDTLAPVYNDTWTAVNYSPLNEGMTEAEYAQVDTLLAAIEETTEVTDVVETLFVDAATLRQSRALVSVTVDVVLMTVENAVDSDKLVTTAKNTVVLDFPENAHDYDVENAIADRKVVENAIATFGDAYVDGCFEATWSELPEVLTENTTLTITYAPKLYEVEGVSEIADSYPYGYQLTLPSHEDAQKAYDYTIAGELYRQGQIVTVLGPIAIEREEVKAYSIVSLYSVIASSFGNAGAKAVLTAGALKGDELVYYRQPNVQEGDMLLLDNVLTVKDAYTSGYNGMQWVPYSYGAKGTEKTFSGNVGSWDTRTVNVRYALYLNDQVNKAAEIVALTETLAADYASQKAGMESLLGKQADVEQLTGMYLSALKGIIRDFKFVDNVKKNQELRNYFINLITEIQANCVTDGSGYLDILAMIKNYRANGMGYYYNNSEVVAAEVEKLSGYLTGLVADEEKQAALAKLLQDPGVDRPELVEKISGLGESLKTINSQLIATNPAIDLNSDNLPALIKALETEGGVSMGNYAAGKAPYIESSNILVQDESAVVLRATVVVDGKEIAIVNTDAYDKWTVLTAGMVAELQAMVDEVLAEEIGAMASYYNIKADVAAALNEQLGQPMTDNLDVTVTADAKQYTVKIDGEADQTITINHLNIKLPAYPNEGSVQKFSYVYTVDGVTLDKLATDYTFTVEQIDTLFVDGTYTITRTVRNNQQDIIDSILGKPDEDEKPGDSEVETKPAATMAFELNEIGEVTAINMSMDASGAGVQQFMTFLMNSGNYVGLGNKAFMNDEGTGLEMSIQTLIDALLHDETFTEQTIIDLGKNNGGKLLNSTMQLGASDQMISMDVPYTMSLSSVPSQLVTLAKALEAAKNNFKFHTDNGILVVELNLPEKVYEVYLTALLAAGEIDTDDMNAVNNEIAFNFLYDYVELVLGNEDITTQTFQNTLEKLDAAANLAGKDLPNKDLTAYEDLFQALRSVFNSVTITRNGDAPLDINVVASQEGLNKVVDALGLRQGAYGTYVGMVKELREGNSLVVNATATLINTTKDFQALVVDLDEGVEGAKDAVDAVRGGKDAIVDEAKDYVKGNGLANAIDYTSDVIGRVSECTGPAAIYLLDDVTGNLVINHTTILDLNGKTITGNITVAGGKLVIVDSKIATTDCGGVNGDVTGNVTIIAGTYTDDVTAFLRDGYTQLDNGSVCNAMYTIEREGKDFNLVLNSDFMEETYVDGYLPSISALAAEIAVDTALNFYIPANLDVDGNRIYGIDDRFNDLIGLVNLSAGELVDTVLAGVGVEGMAAFANTIIADLMDFGAVADAIENDEKIVSYNFETNPWAVEFMHVAEGDYMTVGIVADDEVSRDVTLSLTVVGDNAKKLVALLRELDKIVVYDETEVSVDLKQPVRDGKHIVLEGGAKAHLSLDLTVHGDDGIDHDAYKQMLAVIFAYGNPEKAAVLVDAIGNDEALNAAFNDMTVREVIKALGAMSRTVSFTEMASAVGAADLVADSTADLESLYHLIACASGKVLAKLESMNINGVIDRVEDAADKVAGKIDAKLELTTMKTIVDKAGNVIDRVLAKVDLDSKLGALDQGDGTYLLYYAYQRSGSVDYRGFGADLTLSETSGMLKVKIFGEEDCLWGDANHDNVVDAKDATLVLQHSVDTVAEGQFFCTKRTDVNGDGKIDAKDATLILQHSVGTITKFPVEE